MLLYIYADFVVEWFKDGRSQLEEAGGKFLTIKDICNWRGPINKKVQNLQLEGNKLSWEEQVADTLKHFQDEKRRGKWLADEVICARDEKQGQTKAAGASGASHGVVFGMAKRLEKLNRHGVLSLMDSTHKTNLLKWYLYTVMVRDGYGSYIPCVHYLVDGEDSDILIVCLRKTQDWCRRLVVQEWMAWVPRWFLTDDSAAEQKAVRIAFKDGMLMILL